VVKDPLYVRGESGYTPLTEEAYAKIVGGEARL